MITRLLTILFGFISCLSTLAVGRIIINLLKLKIYTVWNLSAKLILGLSDHTEGDATVLGALALGARVFEKHFKLNDQKKTVDSFFSQNEKQFKKYVSDIRQTEEALNNSKENNLFGFKNMRSIYLKKRMLSLSEYCIKIQTNFCQIFHFQKFLTKHL